MTLSDLTSKTPEELNVMCAELCGWNHREATSSHPVERNGMKLPNYFGDDCEAWWHEGREGVFASPPNYTGSWDAIMPEVRKLEDAATCDFDTHIWQIVNPASHFKGSKGFKHVSFKVHTASPLHLTIALILTLTK